MKRTPSWNRCCLMTSLTKVRSYLLLLADITYLAIIAVHNAQPGWRRVIAQAVLWGIPTPAFCTALAFFDGYRSEVVPANLIQAQARHFYLLENGRADCFRPFNSVITSVHTPSVCFLAKRTPSSRLGRTSVRGPCLSIRGPPTEYV